MINYEAFIFDRVAKELRPLYKGIFIASENVPTNRTFPCVFLVEVENAINTRTLDSSEEEKFVNVTYELNVYSNKAFGKKTECKEIASKVSDILRTLGFTRIMLQPIPNIEQPTIYRMVGRYTATISKNGEIFRR